MTILELDGPAAPPRTNGELVFAEPWEGRAFGLAVTLHDAGAFTWDDFRGQLVAEVAAGGAYYRCWLRALEAVVAKHGLVDPAEVGERAGTLAGRPGDHGHGHL